MSQDVLKVKRQQDNRTGKANKNDEGVNQINGKLSIAEKIHSNHRMV
jgi:hypothetical protein